MPFDAESDGWWARFIWTFRVFLDFMGQQNGVPVRGNPLPEHKAPVPCAPSPLDARRPFDEPRPRAKPASTGSRPGLSTDSNAEMSRQRAYRNRPDRRADSLTADLVDVGLMYARVFGFDRGEDFFMCTVVAPHVYRRVLLGPCRERKPPDDDESMAAA